MKYNHHFAAAAVALLSQANAQWEHANRFSSGISQETYARYFSNYTWVTQHVRSFVDRHRPTQKEEPITDPYEAFGSIAKCSTCEGGFRVAQSKLRDPAIQSLIISTLSNACWLLTDMIAYNSCSLFIEQSTPAIADNLADLLVSPQYSCQVELGYCNREWYTRDFVEAYADRVLATKPESLANDDFIQQLYSEIAADQSERRTLSIIQFTDLHIDLEYKVGANNVCSDVLCCREENGMATDPAQAAGPYGSPAFCDVPISVLDKMSAKINELKPDTLFWTGDVAPHDQWNYSQEYVENYQTFLFNYMQANLGQWTTFPLEGNHDFGLVINSQDFNSQDPILPFLANYWKVWLDDAALQEFEAKGYYTQKFATNNKVYDNVNVIAVNTEACYNANYYLMSNRQDPGNQLAWLEQKLTQMEADGEIAILIGHHPPASESSLYEWGTRFRVLMDRFQHIVRLSFFGHVHTEEHNAIASWHTNTTVGMNFWSGAMTTYTDSYPSFRRFVLDEQTMLPIAIETYRIDVLAEEPEFVLDHSLPAYYSMVDLSPASFDQLSAQLLNDEQLALKYQNTKSQNGPKTVAACDEACRKELYCDTKTSTYTDSRVCQGYTPKDITTDPGYLVTSELMEPWYFYNARPTM